MTLVSFSCCESHRGITTYSQLVATGYSQERKNPRAVSGKRLLKPCYTCSFTETHLLTATGWVKLPLYSNVKRRYTCSNGACCVIPCFGLKHISKRQPLQLALWSATLYSHLNNITLCCVISFCDGYILTSLSVGKSPPDSQNSLCCCQIPLWARLWW